MRKIFISGLMLIFVLTLSGFAAEVGKTKIAVVSNGKTVTSEVSPVAARGPYFLIYDCNGKFIEVLGNPHKNVQGGASSQVVEYLSDKNVSTIIAGTFGNKMIAAMEAKRIRYLTFKGIAAEAVKKVVP